MKPLFVFLTLLFLINLSLVSAMTLDAKFTNYQEDKPLDITIKWFLKPVGQSQQIDVTTNCQNTLTIPPKETISLKCLVDSSTLKEFLYTAYTTMTYKEGDYYYTITSNESSQIKVNSQGIADQLAKGASSLTDGLANLLGLIPTCDKKPEICSKFEGDNFCFLTDSRYKGLKADDMISELSKNKDSTIITIPSDYESRIRAGCLPKSLDGYFDTMTIKSVNKDCGGDCNGVKCGTAQTCSDQGICKADYSCCPYACGSACTNSLTCGEGQRCLIDHSQVNCFCEDFDVCCGQSCGGSCGGQTCGSAERCIESKGQCSCSADKTCCSNSCGDKDCSGSQCGDFNRCEYYPGSAKCGCKKEDDCSCSSANETACTSNKNCIFSPGVVFGRCLPSGSVVPSEDSTSSEWPTLGDAWRWVSARLPKQIADLIRGIYVATRPNVEQLGEPVSTNYAEGAERLTFERMTVIALDPDKLDIRPVYYKEYSNSRGVAIQTILANPKVVAAINGDFFDYEGEPNGPTIINGKEVYPGTPTSRDNIIGGFLVENSGKISIVRNTNLKEVKANYNVKQFFGSGATRTLLFKGQVDEESIHNHPFAEPYYTRSAVCVTNDNKVLFVASLGVNEDYTSIDSHKLAELLKELHCVDAMELDGGLSSIGMGDFYSGSSSRPSYIAAFRK